MILSDRNFLPQSGLEALETLTTKNTQIFNGKYPEGLPAEDCGEGKLLEDNGFGIIKQKGSIRYYGKTGWDRLIRVDYHGAKEVPTGTCHSILKASGIESRKGGR